MRIKFPVTAVQPASGGLAHIKDASGRIIAGGALLDEAEQLVAAANAGTQIQHAQPLAKQPRRKNKREQIENELKNSDYTAREVGRDDVVYGPHDQLPQCGESVARLKR